MLVHGIERAAASAVAQRHVRDGWMDSLHCSDYACPRPSLLAGTGDRVLVVIVIRRLTT